LFSGEKCKHTITKLAFCSPNGIFYYLSPTYTGSKADVQIMTFPENYIFEKLEGDEYISFDKGFKGYQKHWSKVVLPYIYAKDSQLLPDDMVFNNNFKSISTVIEMCFVR
jgi:hypothetical protein